MTRAFALAALIALYAASAAAGPCDTPEHRQFDFWVGDWAVHKASDNSVAGMNRVTLEYGNCVVHEHYITGRGYAGESLNIYDASRKVWHQSWVDDSGLLLVIEGGWNGKAMVMEGVDAKKVKQRITWTPNADGSVRQLWETGDGKGGWTTAFDGIYTKK